MKALKKMGLRLSVAAGVAALLGGSLAAIAETQIVDRTELELRLANGQIEKLAFDSLQSGEQRSLSTEAGNLAIVSKQGDTLKVETAGEVFEVQAPDPEIEAAIAQAHAEAESDAEGSDGEGAHRKIVIHTDDQNRAADGRVERKKIVMIKAKGDAPMELEDLDVIELEDEALPEGKRIKMMRKIEHRKSDVTE